MPCEADCKIRKRKKGRTLVEAKAAPGNPNPPLDKYPAPKDYRAAIDAISAAATMLSAEALELHVADARAFIGRETRHFDVIFLDPPFRDDPWGWLLPACSERLAAGGYVYAEAGRAIPPPPT